MTAPASSTQAAPPRAAAERASPPQAPRRDSQSQEQFESALRRRQHDDGLQHEHATPDTMAGAGFTLLSPTLPAPAGAGADAALPLTSGAMPRTAAAGDAVSQHLRSLGTTPTDGGAAQWQVRWADAGAPLRQLDVQRSDNGALHLGLTPNALAGAHATDAARLARLRDRVAARVAADVEVHTTTASRRSRSDGSNGRNGLNGLEPDDEATA